MIKVSIQKQGIETNAATFDQQADADAWLAQEVANGSFGDPSTYQVVQTDITAQLAQAKAIADAQVYLASTDWMIIRQMDNGTPLDPDVKAKRQAARLVINPQLSNSTP